MSVSRRAFLSAAVVCAGLAALGGKAESGRTKTIESALGDLVRISIEDHADARASDVALCLLNTSVITPKGFDIRSAAEPRFIAAPGDSVCARVTAGHHELVLWKAVEGRLSPVIRTSLDLSRAQGSRATIDW